jgi:hypothetical protein
MARPGLEPGTPRFSGRVTRWAERDELRTPARTAACRLLAGQGSTVAVGPVVRGPGVLSWATRNPRVGHASPSFLQWSGARPQDVRAEVQYEQAQSLAGCSSAHDVNCVPLSECTMSPSRSWRRWVAIPSAF